MDEVEKGLDRLIREESSWYNGSEERELSDPYPSTTQEALLEPIKAVYDKTLSKIETTVESMRDNFQHYNPDDFYTLHGTWMALRHWGDDISRCQPHKPSNPLIHVESSGPVLENMAADLKLRLARIIETHARLLVQLASPHEHAYRGTIRSLEWQVKNLRHFVKPLRVLCDRHRGIGLSVDLDAALGKVQTEVNEELWYANSPDLRDSDQEYALYYEDGRSYGAQGYDGSQFPEDTRLAAFSKEDYGRQTAPDYYTPEYISDYQMDPQSTQTLEETPWRQDAAGGSKNSKLPSYQERDDSAAPLPSLDHQEPPTYYEQQPPQDLQQQSAKDYEWQQPTEYYSQDYRYPDYAQKRPFYEAASQDEQSSGFDNLQQYEPSGVEQGYEEEEAVNDPKGKSHDKKRRGKEKQAAGPSSGRHKHRH